jgi:hypothetical protein
MNILEDINILINQVEEAFSSVLGSYGKIAGDIQDMETNKAAIMKLPLIPPPQKVAMLQTHINQTEQLKQIAVAKQQEISNYGDELINKHAQSLNKNKDAKSSRNS